MTKPRDKSEDVKFFTPVCVNCKHWLKGTRTCAAFDVRIPDEIFVYGNKHNKKINGQDNEILFEAK